MSYTEYDCLLEQQLSAYKELEVLDIMDRYEEVENRSKVLRERLDRIDVRLGELKRERT